MWEFIIRGRQLPTWRSGPGMGYRRSSFVWEILLAMDLLLACLFHSLTGFFYLPPGASPCFSPLSPLSPTTSCTCRIHVLVVCSSACLALQLCPHFLLPPLLFQPSARARQVFLSCGTLLPARQHSCGGSWFQWSPSHVLLPPPVFCLPSPASTSSVGAPNTLTSNCHRS